MMRITIEPWNWYRHFVKGDPQTLLKMKPGVAVAEKRTKANSPNVGVAARHDLFIKKATEAPHPGLSVDAACSFRGA